MRRSFLLRDVQVRAADGRDFELQRRANIALFATYEPLRLALHTHRISAPFAKLVVELHDAARPTGAGGRVFVMDGICVANEDIDGPELAMHCGDHRWVLARISRALPGVSARLGGWRSAILEATVRAISEATWPLVHHFEPLGKVSAEGIRCVPWLAFVPGVVTLGVQIGDHAVVVAESDAPLLFEDRFPLHATAIRGGDFLLMDRSRSVLASIPIRPSGA